MQKDQEWYKKRISFLEKENRRSLIALSEINSFESFFTSISENTDIEDIYHVTCNHLNAFVDFSTIAFMSLDEELAFKISYQRGLHDENFIQDEIDAKIEKRIFAKVMTRIKNPMFSIKEPNHCIGILSLLRRHQVTVGVSNRGRGEEILRSRKAKSIAIQ